MKHARTHNPQERRSMAELPVSEYFHGKPRVFDKREGVYVVKIFSGEWHVSSSGDEMLATILGSCVSACIRDPYAGVGGMNHFLLPGKAGRDANDAARYGVHAMESLINGILTAGGQKQRLEVKVFGGGDVIKNSARIGSQNAEFIKEFLQHEGYRITSEDLGGEHPRSLHYYPTTGRVMLRHLKRKDDMVVADEEAIYKQRIKAAPLEGEIELFT